MNIILKGADFSANNIGQIELPIIYVNETIAYLNAIPNSVAVMSTIQKRAINTFFRSLTKNNLYDKITRAYLPIFGQIEGGVNLVNVTQTRLNLPSTSVTYSSKGALFETAMLSNFSFNFASSHHIGFANLDEFPAAFNGQLSAAITRASGSFNLGRGVANSNADSGYTISGSERANRPNYRNSKGVVLGAKNSILSVWQASVNGEYATSGNFTTNLGATNPIIGGTSAVAGASGLARHSISYLTFGESPMTEQELSIYSGLIQSLMDAF